MDPFFDCASGQQRAWSIYEKFGEGDAGEVFRVESLLDHRAGILKRPRKNGFPSDAIRQANQIEKEGQVLAALNRMDNPNRMMQPPVLLDRGKPGTEFSDRFFIVVTEASGFNLSYLARAIHFGSIAPTMPGDPEIDRLPPLEKLFLEKLVERGSMPHLLILRCLDGLLQLFEAIHTLQVETPNGQAFGVIWNDVKPDHIFWSPVEGRFTLIDWGNAQFLDVEGVTRDRLNTRFSDYQQFLTTLGRFVEEETPELYTRLKWPVYEVSASLYTEGILPLKERISQILAEETEALEQSRREEQDILIGEEYSPELYRRLLEVHSVIFAAGELPDASQAERFFVQVARTLVENGEIAAAGELFHEAISFSSLPADDCDLLEQIAAAVAEGEIPDIVLLSALSSDWKSAFWELRQLTARRAGSTQTEDIADTIRAKALGQDPLRPRVALNRLIYALQSSGRNKEDDPNAQLLASLKEEILPRWTVIEPDPPNSGIDYRELDALIESIEALNGETGLPFLRALDQPRLQAGAVIDAWNRKDFETARLGLRQLLLWDPDRVRVLLADRALLAIPDWLADIAAGPRYDEPLQEFITRLELTGREYRNQIGHATWLDSLLDAFKQLRKGGEPTDVLVQHPEARDELAWLVVLEPRRPLLATPGRSVQIERLPLPEVRIPILGMKETALGAADGIHLGEPLDTWAAEARGSSARIFDGELPGLSGERIRAAMKLMRPDRADYALPLFNEEVRILSMMRDVPGVAQMLECGFIRLEGSEMPAEERHISASDLIGEVQRFGPDSVHNFLSDLEKRTAQGWIPYLAIDKQERADNLLLLCDTGHTHGRFMPILEGLVVALQICDILEVAHTRDIVYRDHKILHYYWRSEYNGVMMIDWNVARRHPGGLSEAEIQFDLVQFGARALHYIFVGRSAPGALPMGPNRPDEIEAAQKTYAAQWAYDDQRLPKDIKDLLEAALAGQYSSARTLREDIFTIYQKLAELV